MIAAQLRQVFFYPNQKIKYCFILLFLCIGALFSVTSFAMKQNALQARDTIYLQHIVATPWAKHFIMGDLSSAAFQRFLGQDVLYLADYEKVSHMIALRFPAGDARRAFFERYAKGAKEERLWELKQLKAAHYEIPHHKIAVNAAYTHYLLDKGKNGTLPEAVAALIPCDTLWEELGSYFQHHVKDIAHHPYKRWIVAYSDPSFERVAQEILHVEKKLLAQEPQLTSAAIDAYKKAANFEVKFFQAAMK
ncbi:MAG: thiaminase II/PqqC family protein [Gammaproteobacteria bacterium]